MWLLVVGLLVCECVEDGVRVREVGVGVVDEG